MRDLIRTAQAMDFSFVMEDPMLHAINRRIVAASGTRYEQGGPMQVLPYEPGQEYKLHSDCLPGGGNQRFLTFLITLTGGFEGGETQFPRLPLSFRGKVGDAVQFTSLDLNGKPDPLAWHAGAPVTRGRKLILSKWIRQAPLDLAGPARRPF